MIQRFSRPDAYAGLTGRLRAVVTGHRIAGAPAFMRGLRILFASDIHVLPGTSADDIKRLVDTFAAAEPDLLLLGGDYSDTAENALRLIRSLGALKTRLGRFASVGNNDLEAWRDDLPRLRGAMAEAGCELLINESRRLEIGDGSLWIAGLDDSMYGSPDARGLYPDRPSPGAWRVLLSHEPIMVSPAPDLMLSGHTHGGQFNLLGITPYAIGFENLFGKRRVRQLAVAGLHDVGDMKLLVSKGVGASRLQLRIGVRPEVNLLVFE